MKGKYLASVSSFALAAIAAALSCASPPIPADSPRALRIMDADADYVALGLSKDGVAAWEDGRRTPRSKECFEWWYFDGLLDDGTVIVAWLGDNWAFGTDTRNVSLEVTPPGQKTRAFYKAYAEPGSYSKERADTRFGPHSFSGDLERYRIVVDAADAGGFGIDLELRRTVASYRPGTGQVASGGDYFAWVVAVPNGELSGTLTVDGKARAVRGSGYHDHNWGNVSLVELLDSWWWGRAVVGGRTIIVSELRAKASRGGTRIPLYLVASPAGVEVNAWGADAIAAEGKPVAHPDPAHGNPIGSSFSMSAKGLRATFPISARYLTSVDLLDKLDGGTRFLGRLAGMHPWYSRFFSRVTLEVPGSEPVEGEGTLEYIEFK